MSEPARLYLITPLVSDVAAFAPVLAEALTGQAADHVDCVWLRFGDVVSREQRAVLVRQVQAAGAAALISGEAREASRIGADGVHLAANDAALADALQRMRPDGIVGVGAISSRDQAMTAGEREPDYLMFGEPKTDGFVPPLLTTLDHVRWWAELFTVPCVAYAAALDDVWPLVDAGAEFIALGDALWQDARGPKAVVMSLSGVLSRKAFA